MGAGARAAQFVLHREEAARAGGARAALEQTPARPRDLAGAAQEPY